jgi:LysM repeat protein
MAIANQTDQRLEQLKQKYASVLNLIQQQGVVLQHVHVQDNKLFIQGQAPSEEIKNKVWDQIKLVDPSFSDLTADITVDPNAQRFSSSAQRASTQGQTYTVKPGDTLSKISQHIYGDPNRYTEIFEANKDQLSDPNKIQPGQTLRIP